MPQMTFTDSTPHPKLESNTRYISNCILPTVMYLWSVNSQQVAAFILMVVTL